MNCNEFEKHIKDFIFGEMYEGPLEAFMEHFRSCGDCYDDLEIFYIAHIGLNNLDKEDSSSYDIKSELQKIINSYERSLRRCSKFRGTARTVFIAADVITAISVLIGLLSYLNILY